MKLTYLPIISIMMQKRSMAIDSKWMVIKCSDRKAFYRLGICREVHIILNIVASAA
ncbi:MAG: hypothetical protein WAU01_07380 [Saprospiraceae bacterium]